jgi:hypothetical protein
MARRPHARHQRPSGRAGLEAAYTALQVDLAQVRWDRYADHLEIVRLGALADGLLTEVQRRSDDIARLRRELHDARTTPQREDPLVAVLASQVTELRATVAEQQRRLAEATAQIQALLAAAAAAAPIAPAQEAAPAPSAAPTPDTAPTAEAAEAAADPAPIATPYPQPTPVPALAPAPAPLLVDLVETPALVGVGARGAAPVAENGTAAWTAPSADGDDESVRRLRLIREGNGR